MSQSSGSSPAGSTHTGLLITLTIIAALGGLLFGYDSAVISGATVSIKQNFVAPMGLAEGARLSLEGFTIAGALWGCLIGGALVLAAVFYHYGEVLFWHKQVLFWSTVVVVMYFMFNEPKRRP